jgi:iron(III) transport system ATP-binding protein
VLGPSGSGKSTLLRLVAGLERLQRGAIAIAGRTVSAPGLHVPPERRPVGFVFQDYALFPHLDARHNVAFGMAHLPRRQRLRTADALLERVGLASHARAMPHTLSGGQQQRVALARALARRPQVMLLDEPFSGLDRQLRSDVRRITLELLRESGAATLMITHDPEEALLVGDRLSVLRAGRLLQSGAPEEIFRRPHCRQVAEVFGPVNRLDARARSGRVASPWGDLAARAPDGCPLEGSVEVLIRPDALVLARANGAVPPATARGEIVAASPAGGLLRLLVELPEVTVEVHDLARRGWRIGDAVQVSLLEGAAWVLPQAGAGAAESSP